jgi:hypothetical protein
MSLEEFKAIPDEYCVSFSSRLCDGTDITFQGSQVNCMLWNRLFLHDCVGGMLQKSCARMYALFKHNHIASVSRLGDYPLQAFQGLDYCKWTLNRLAQLELEFGFHKWTDILKEPESKHTISILAHVPMRRLLRQACIQ